MYNQQLPRYEKKTKILTPSLPQPGFGAQVEKVFFFFLETCNWALSWPPLVTGLISNILDNSAVGET